MWSACSLSDDGAMSEAAAAEHQYEVPRVPASAGALIFDGAGRLLILKPNYKKGWTIPGGQIDANGESPWDACRRETREECGLEVVRGRLVCVDFRTLKPNRRDDPVSVQASSEKADRLGGREQANSRGTQALGGEPKRKQRRKDANAQIEQGSADERRSDAPRQPHAPGGRTRCR